MTEACAARPLGRRRRRLLPYLLLPFLWPLTAGATTYRALSPDQLAQAADLIFLGTVTELNPVSQADYPWTDVTFAVEAWYLDSRPDAAAQDQPAPATVTLRFLGGASASGPRLSVSGVPAYRQGQRVLIFAYDQLGLASPVVGVQQGSFTVDAQGAGIAGAYLSVTEAGGLQLAPSGAAVQAVGEAVRRLLEAEPEAQPAPQEAEAAAEAAAADTAAGEAAFEAPPETGPADAAAPEAAPVSPASAEAGSALAATLQVDYRVDDAGGPLLLSTAVSQAAAAWQAAAPGIIEFGAVADGAADPAVSTIGYGNPALFGPDALSFTLIRDGVTSLLVSPTAAALLPGVLLHELGVLAGLPEEGSGVMAHVVTAGTLAPTESDVAALTALRRSRPEDVNRDGVVDFYDLAALAADYGRTGVNLAADINADGVVDEADLSLLRAAYQFTPPAELPPGQ